MLIARNLRSCTPATSSPDSRGPVGLELRRAPIDLRTTHHRDESPTVVNAKLFRKWRPCRTL
jgi:hypothetical protein